MQSTPERPSSPSQRKAVTILDIARAAGVSRTAASSALSGGGRVSEETRERVLAVARELDYVGNPAARSLRTGRTGAIGLYIPWPGLSSSFYTQFLAGVAGEAEGNGYAVTLMPPHEGTLQQRLLAQVDAVIVVDPLLGDPVVRQQFASGLPIVCAERCLDPDLQPTVTIETDYVSSARQLLDHMRQQGATSPALLSAPFDASFLKRFEMGYTHWCEENAVSPIIYRPEEVNSPDRLVDFVERILSRPDAPDALLTAADGTALSVTTAARRLGLELGRDLLLSSGIDNSVYGLVSPTITSTLAPPGDIGRDAARVLRDILDGVEVPRHVMREAPDVALRESTGAA